jgi:phage terminase large subunit-like protein
MEREINQEDWEALSDEKELSKRRSAAEEQFKDLPSDEIAYLRKWAKNDLFFLTNTVLDYELLSPKLHKSYCMWKQETRGHQYRIELMPRGHYKTTVNIGESVQIALPNDGGVVQEHPWTLGTDVKILLSHETEKGASRALFEIAEAFLSKPMMLALFPECIPTRRNQRINTLELELPRQTHWKEPTFDVIGAGGAAQGRHYHRLKLDDLIGEKARESQTIMQTVLDWMDNVNSLLTRPRLDGWDLIGTRWTLFDVYSHVFDRYGVDFENSILNAVDQDKERLRAGLLAGYVRSAIEFGEIIFPEEFTMEFFEVLMQNRKVWAAQYANNPLDESLTEFSSKWLKFYNVTQDGDLVIFEGDHGVRRVKTAQLDRVVLIDPSMGESEDADETGIVVTGTDNKNNIYVLETIRKRLKPHELIRTMFELNARWYPRLISVEEVNFSAVYRYWFEQECERLKIHPSIHGYKTHQRQKESRVRGLGPLGIAGQIFVAENMHEFREEWERFGVTKNFHLLDAMAQGKDVWQAGMIEADAKTYAQAEKKIVEMRSAYTGY